MPMIMKSEQNLHDKLEAWADETAKAYDKIASDRHATEHVDLPFYTQSPLDCVSEAPRLLIAGINPGSDGSYTAQKENPNWDIKKGMDGKHLLKGNFCRQDDGKTAWEHRCKWNYWHGLKKYFSKIVPEAEWEDSTKVVLTNASFFATKKADDISESLLRKTLPYTIELVKILAPKRIAFFGAGCFGRLQEMSRCLTGEDAFRFTGKELYHGIYICRFNGIQCYCLPHPAFKSNELFDLVASTVAYLNDNVSDLEEIDIEDTKRNDLIAPCLAAYEQRCAGKQASPSGKAAGAVYEYLKENFLKGLSTYGGKDWRYKLTDEIGLTAKPGEGKIHIRHIGFENGPNYVERPEYYSDEKKFRDILKQSGWDIDACSHAWLGTKKMGAESGEALVNELKRLRKKLQ